MITETYSDELHRFLTRRMRDRPQDVDDVMQEVRIRLLKAPAQVIEKPLAYLYRTAAHVLFDFAAKRKQSEPLDDEAMQVPDQADPIGDLDTHRLLERALSKLRPQHAAALVLRYQDGRTTEEIAERLGIAPSSVDKFLTRGKAQMRKVLLDEFRELTK